MTRSRWIAAALAVTALNGSPATADEQSYYDGSQWQVVLVDNHAATGEKPYCAVRTTAWTSKFVSIENPLLGIDSLGFAIRVQKDGWALPVGQSTEFAFLVGPAGAKFTAKAISQDELYTAFDPKALTEGWIMFDRVYGAAFSDRGPMALTVGFRGNEKPWSAPKIDQFQAVEINAASRRCNAALNEMGPSIFGAVAEAEHTSPFGTQEETPLEEEKDARHALQDFAEGGGGSTGSDAGHRNAQSTNEPMTKWAFTFAEEDWGWVCVVETKKDNLQIGFMATPGEGIVAFIDGLDLQTAKAVWRVDSNRAYPVEGELNEYFAWLGFDLPSASLIDELTRGTTLNVSVLGKARYTFDVSSARDAFTQFIGCHSKNKASTNASSE